MKETNTTKKEEIIYGTKEMFDYQIKLQEEQNERNDKNNKINTERQVIEKRLREISNAVIGFGSALTALANEKNILEIELKNKVSPCNYINIDDKFKSKFGISYYALKFELFK